ncbi:MAG: sodium/proline symporter [Ruminiclostridium sp.]|nr:sodium/proline symporter [Ruminiclostridium sp.]
MVIIIITIICYLALMVGIGVAFSRKNKDVGDFYLGGRKLGPIVAAMSAEASDMSSWLLMGLPGVAYLCGCAEAGWTAIGLAVGTYLNWLFVAKRLRLYSQRCGAITIPDFFAKRYREDKNILLGVSALIILIFFIPYTASGFSACGKLFEQLFGWDYHIAMLISAAIIILYTSIGGFLAASTTDLIQSIVMTAALIIVVIFGISNAGGLDSVIENAKSMSGYLTLFESHNQDGSSSPYDFLTIVSTMAWGLGYFGMPHILLRFMAIKDHRKIGMSRRIASIWVVISMGVAIFIGIIANTLSRNGLIDTFTKSSESETAIIKIAFFMSENGVLLAIFAGLIFAGILACTMSTADSQLLAASSSASENILKGVFKVKLTEKQSMLVARAVLLFIAVAAVIIAWDKDSSIFNIVSFAWGGFGATFGPVMLLALFWKRSTKWGAAAGMAVGGVMVFVWKFLLAPIGGVFAIYELFPAFVIALIVNVTVSLLTKAPEDEVVKEFDAVKADMKNGAPVSENA